LQSPPRPELTLPSRRLVSALTKVSRRYQVMQSTWKINLSRHRRRWSGWREPSFQSQLAESGKSRIYTNDEVRNLNVTARERLRAPGGWAMTSLTVDRGERAFAPGDRVMLLKNDRDLG